MILRLTEKIGRGRTSQFVSYWPKLLSVMVPHKTSNKSGELLYSELHLLEIFLNSTVVKKHQLRTTQYTRLNSMARKNFGPSQVLLIYLNQFRWCSRDRAGTCSQGRETGDDNSGPCSFVLGTWFAVLPGRLSTFSEDYEQQFCATSDQR
jgi:hypothetical protein